MIKRSIKIFFTLSVLTGLLYPLLITGLSQLFLPGPANGSLVWEGNLLRGSSLIAQNPPKEGYFLPRPSAIGYDPLHPSGGSNLGWTSQKLQKQIEKRKQKFGDTAPPLLLYASGSGLDPHIDLAAAHHQIPTIARERHISEAELKKLVDRFREGWSTQYVNVFILNQALDNTHE